MTDTVEISGNIYDIDDFMAAMKELHDADALLLRESVERVLNSSDAPYEFAAYMQEYTNRCSLEIIQALEAQLEDTEPASFETTAPVKLHAFEANLEDIHQYVQSIREHISQFQNAGASNESNT